MSNIKKVFVELVELLEANSNKKISSIMPEILELVEGKNKSQTYKLNEAGEVTHVFCYYHKEWEDVSEIEYGQKKSTAHGLNTMCKVGVSQWTKQQRDARKSKDEVMNAIIAGELEGSGIESALQEIEATRLAIVN